MNSHHLAHQHNTTTKLQRADNSNTRRGGDQPCQTNTDQRHAKPCQPWPIPLTDHPILTAHNDVQQLHLRPLESVRDPAICAPARQRFSVEASSSDSKQHGRDTDTLLPTPIRDGLTLCSKSVTSRAAVGRDPGRVPGPSRRAHRGGRSSRSTPSSCPRTWSRPCEGPSAPGRRTKRSRSRSSARCSIRCTQPNAKTRGRSAWPKHLPSSRAASRSSEGAASESWV